jgi:small-conductance mechanosensitive channel
MRRPVAILVGAFLGCSFVDVAAWGQLPKFPAIDRPAEESANQPDSPYALPRSAPMRRSLDAVRPADRSLYGDAPSESTQTVPPQDAATSAPTDDVALPAAPSIEPPAANLSPAAAANSSMSASLPESPQITNEESTAESSERENSDFKNKESSGENAISLKLPYFVPKPIRDVWDKIVALWRYELFMKVTVENLLIALVLLFVGYIAAKRISSWFASRVLGRLGIQPNNVATIRTISFYALMAAFTLSTLGALGVPVTIFSYFGGALAVGIGFGSQNIVNNFISGLILLAERPIRVGDVIQIDGVTGKVTEIGARSTRITTGSNMEILVPNSTILQGNVVNWTLSDDMISSKVTVGVAYGSPARQVARLLLLAAAENADLLKDPAPGVSFTNFGDHALEFQLSFWLRLSQADGGKIESDLRFAIDDLFAQHGIIIAYPQRDVHLNLLRPVEVRLTPPAGELRRAAA